jgi:hypothetical protein
VNERGKQRSDAEVLRRILAGLRDGGPVPQVAGILATPSGRPAHCAGAGRPEGDSLPPPPSWATHSVLEDGGVTHERVSTLHPLAYLDRAAVPLDRAAPGLQHSCPTDVSVSVVDRPGAVRWVRLPPTIQVEGGSYGILEARRLVRAIEGLIALVL